MLGGRRSRTLWIAAVLPLFAAAVLPTHFQTLVCRFSGIVMDIEVCCPSVPRESRDTHSQLRAEDCCVLKSVDLQKLVTERRTDGAQPREHEALAAMPLVGTSDPSRRQNHALQVGPPPMGPPILLLKRSFLI